VKTYDKHIRETRTLPSYHPLFFRCEKFYTVAKFWTFSVGKFNVFVENFAKFRIFFQEIARFLYMVELLRPKIHKDI
jgi:hypothetical protein